ncbi:MAG: sodium:solute symporter [Bacteroidetes bacterium]|nr:sodium:solute symporter [Bacteroidota bacterium]
MNDSYILPAFIGIYMLVIAVIAVIAAKRSKNLETYSVGTRNVSPVWIAIALAANMVSVATFVINPGIVYLYGISGFLGYGVSSLLGILISLITVTKLFRKVGDKYSALTLPHWIGKRFDSSGLQIFFALVSFLLISFIVMITVGVTQVVSTSLEIRPILVMLVFMIFVFGYILVGGAVAHTLTNSFQGIIMIVATFFMLSQALPWFSNGLDGFLTSLRSIDPVLAEPVNPASALFRDYFEVFFANFIVGIAVVMQPHIMSKALFLRSEKDVNTYLISAGIIATIFFMLIGMGLIARLELNGTDLLRPDKAIASYLLTDGFSPLTRGIVVLGIICSSISTMEGLLLSISSITSNDLALRFLKKLEVDESERKKKALNIGRVILVVTGIISFFLSYDQFYNPSLSVAIFAQNGVYGLFSATFVPVLFGTFLKEVKASTIWLASVSALLVHFGMYYLEISRYHNNPGVTVTFAILSSVIVGVTAHNLNSART